MMTIQYSTPIPPIRKTSLCLLFIIVTIFYLNDAVQAKIFESTDQTLYFSSKGNVYKFKRDSYFIASSNYMLSVGFEGSDGAPPRSADFETDKTISPRFSKVTYQDLWPGISLHYEATASGIGQSTWVIAAGRAPEKIRLRYSAPVNIDKNGSLKILYAAGWLKESAPIAWQIIDGRHQSVEVAFCLLKNGENNQMVSFDLGKYNPAYPLLIDPTLEWNTFLGTTEDEHYYSRDDKGHAIALDINGNVYVAGTSGGPWGTPLIDHGWQEDAFVAKTDANGNLLWNTFLGAGASDDGYAIEVDAEGYVYIAGRSEVGWGTPIISHSQYGTYDAFVAKLDTNGLLVWNTFLGGSDGVDYGRSIALDDGGNIYVAGNSNATWGSPVNAYSGGGGNDAIVVKLHSSGVLLWNTFIGAAANNDEGRAITVDSTGNVYITGNSYVTWGAPRRSHSGSWDAFAAKLNTDGELQWNTFIGGNGIEESQGVALDRWGRIIVTGYTSGPSWGTPVDAFAGGWDGYVATLSSSGYRWWHTYMGSAHPALSDVGNALTVDISGNIFVVGSSKLTWGDPIHPYIVASDAFILKLNVNGLRLWNTFLGGVGDDHGKAIVVENDGNTIYIAGYSDVTWGTPVRVFGSQQEVFAAKLGRDTGCKFYYIPTKNGKGVAICL